MNNDRELLELAAKAAGYSMFEMICLSGRGIDLMPYVDTGNGQEYWNPLTDDGDALRPAVKLGVDIYVDDGKSEVWVTEFNHPIEHFDNDPYAATRRAIVRAAAEIGKEMK